MPLSSHLFSLLLMFFFFKNLVYFSIVFIVCFKIYFHLFCFLVYFNCFLVFLIIFSSSDSLLLFFCFFCIFLF